MSDSMTTEAPWPTVELDHLVVAAHTLDEGIAWSTATLGVVPSAGGRHPLMSTHNVLLDLSSPRFPRSYLEIVAVDPQAPPVARRRWFGLDDPALRQALTLGPRLVHWVARTRQLDRVAALAGAAGHEPGPATAAERSTPAGTLRWRITIPADGSRPAAGALPLFIEWDGPHPTDSLPDSGVVLSEIVLGGVTAEMGERLGGVATVQAPPFLGARLQTPRGIVELRSP